MGGPIFSWMVYFMEKSIMTDDLGVPSGNLHGKMARSEGRELSEHQTLGPLTGSQGAEVRRAAWPFDKLPSR